MAKTRKNKVSPILNGIVGAPAGGLVWDEKNLSGHLQKPRDLIDRTKMTFAGLRDDDEIKDVIAYLATFP